MREVGAFEAKNKLGQLLEVANSLTVAVRRGRMNRPLFAIVMTKSQSMLLAKMAAPWPS